MNSVMQALVHTPPLAFALLTQELDVLHGEWGGKPNAAFDAVTAMHSFAKRSLQGTRPTNAPQEFNRNLKAFAKPLRQGRRRTRTSTCASSRGAAAELPRARTQVAQARRPRAPHDVRAQDVWRQAAQPRHVPQLRPQLATPSTPSWTSASTCAGHQLAHRRAARLCRQGPPHGAEKYKCDKCKRKVDATKQFTIDAAPPALTVHLKRFTVFGGKVSRQIAFDDTLNIAPYLSVNNGPRGTGCTPRCTTTARAPTADTMWRACARHRASGCAWTTATWRNGPLRPTNDQSAYILFYLREKDEALETALAAVAPSKSAPTSLEAKKRKKAAVQETVSESESDASADELTTKRPAAICSSAARRRRRLRCRRAPSRRRNDDAADKPALGGPSAKLDELLSARPKSAASFYGSSSGRPANPFSMPSADDEELGTSVDRDEYEAMWATRRASPPRARSTPKPMIRMTMPQ